MNIVNAVYDGNLFRPFFGGSLQSWCSWLGALRCVYGIPLLQRDEAVINECTKREPAKLPSSGFQESLFLVGRRGGKSVIAAVLATYEALFGEGRNRLGPGEEGLALVVAPSKRQARKVYDYCRAIFDQSEILRNEIVAEQSTGFSLRGNVRIEIGVADHRLIRGHTLLAAVLDEICFLQTDPESRIRNDSDLVQAVRPGLSTTNGKLIAISSPYSRKGWAYATWKRCFGNDASDILVWQAPSRTMNENLPEAVVERALKEDLASARAEYLAKWRDDVCSFLPRDIIEKLVVAGRQELLPRESIKYFAFCDLSGGRVDSAALAIAHQNEKKKVIIDFLREWKPPFSPVAVIEDMASELRRFHLNAATGDFYGAEYTASGFAGVGIRYVKATKNKSELYLELLPRLCSGEIELLDNSRLIDQLAGLERRTRSGGKDSIDHAQGQHDDLSNVVAGVCFEIGQKRQRAGAINLWKK